MKLREIADRLSCGLEGDGEVEITGVAGVEEAEAGQLTFLSNPKYTTKLAQTAAAAAIVSKDFQNDLGRALPLLRHNNPYLTFARAIELFYTPPPGPDGIHPTAIIAPSAKLGSNARIGAHSVIGEDVRIEDDVTV